MMYSPASDHAMANVYLAGALRAPEPVHTASFGAAVQPTGNCRIVFGHTPVTGVSPVAEAPQDILIARPEARRTMGLPDLVLPINLTILGDLVSKQPVNSLTVAQAVAEHEQLLGQLKALMALRDYIPVHIYNSASAHLFGPEELKRTPTGPQLRPEYATLRAYAAGNIELCKSLFAELDRHLHEVLGPRLDELGMLRYGQEWPQPPQHFAR